MHRLLRRVILVVVLLGYAVQVEAASANTEKAEAAWCPAVVMAGDAVTLRAYIEKIRVTKDHEKGADLMVDFRHCAGVRGLAALKDRETVMAIAALLDDWFLIVNTAYLLGDIGSAARPALPKMKALLAIQPDPADADGFVFNRDGKPIGALENAIARIERSSNQ